MKTKKLISLALPALLLVGCGVTDNSTETKTEAASTEDDKVKVDEDRYPVYVMREFDLYTKNLVKYHEAIKRVNNGESILRTVEFSLSDIASTLKRTGNIEAPSKYEPIQEKINEGVEESSKGVEMMQEAHNVLEKVETGNVDKEELAKAKEKSQLGLEVLENGYDIMTSALDELDDMNPDAFDKAVKLNEPIKGMEE